MKRGVVCRSFPRLRWLGNKSTSVACPSTNLDFDVVILTRSDVADQMEIPPADLSGVAGSLGDDVSLVEKHILVNDDQLNHVNFPCSEMFEGNQDLLSGKKEILDASQECRADLISVANNSLNMAEKDVCSPNSSKSRGATHSGDSSVLARNSEFNFSLNLLFNNNIVEDSHAEKSEGGNIQLLGKSSLKN